MSEQAMDTSPRDEAMAQKAYAATPTGSALDRSFMPTWLMGGAVLVVALLSVISGWKIFNMESERAKLESDRRVFERNKKAYKTLLKELPALEENWQALTRKVGELEGNAQGAQARVDSLTTQATAAVAALKKAEAGRIQAEAATAAVA